MRFVFDGFFNLAPPPNFNDPFDFFNMMMMSDAPIGDLDWLNIESEENIRPRKRQNIITISRMFFSKFSFDFLTYVFFKVIWKVYPQLL